MNNKADYKTPEGFDKKNANTSYGEIKQIEYFSTTTTVTRKCLIYTPPGFDPQKTYPVLYLLHGIGGTHMEWLFGSPNEVLSNLIATCELKPLIAVIPNVRAAKDDSLPQEVFTNENIAAFDNFINDLKNDLMPFVAKNYPVSQKREDRAIAGLSMGGRESLFIGFTMSETFGYIGAFSPAPGLLPNTGSLPGSDKSFPGQISQEQFVLPDEYKDKTFILICNGNQDNLIFDVPFVYHKALEKNGIRHTYYTIDGGHDFEVWKNGLYHFAKNIFLDITYRL